MFVLVLLVVLFYFLFFILFFANPRYPSVLLTHKGKKMKKKVYEIQIKGGRKDDAQTSNENLKILADLH